MAEGFGHRDVDQRVGLPVEGTDAVVRHRAEQGYRVADALVSRHAPQVGGGEIGVGAGDPQLVRDGVASAQRREGLEQAGVVLVAVEGGDGQQVRAGGTLRGGRLFKLGGDVRGQTVGHHAEASPVETQQADRFAGGSRRPGDNPVCATQRATDRGLQVAAAQPAKLVRVREELQRTQHDDAGARPSNWRDVDGVKGDVGAGAPESERVTRVLVQNAEWARSGGGSNRVEAHVWASGQFVEDGEPGTEDVPGGARRQVGQRGNEVDGGVAQRAGAGQQSGTGSHDIHGDAHYESPDRAQSSASARAWRLSGGATAGVPRRYKPSSLR